MPGRPRSGLATAERRPLVNSVTGEEGSRPRDRWLPPQSRNTTCRWWRSRTTTPANSEDARPCASRSRRKIVERRQITGNSPPMISLSIPTRDAHRAMATAGQQVFTSCGGCARNSVLHTTCGLRNVFLRAAQSSTAFKQSAFSPWPRRPGMTSAHHESVSPLVPSQEESSPQPALDECRRARAS